jgi:hypothetical protein
MLENETGQRFGSHHSIRCLPGVDVSFRHAARLLKEHSADELIGQERVDHLTKLGRGKDKEVCLLLMADAYRKRREEWGFRS